MRMRQQNNPRKWQGPKPASNELRVGFYGCTNQLVRVSYVQPANTRAPQHFEIDCPACGSRHDVNAPMWRKAHSADEFMLADVHLENEDA